MMKPKQSENWAREDRDLLVSLNTKFNVFVEQYQLDIKELKDGTAVRIADHESRIKTIEQEHQKMGGTDSVYARFVKVEQKVHDDQIRANLIRLLAGAVGGAVMFLLTQLVPLLRSWGVFGR